MSVVRIAERAGVSIATVSRVVNNSRPVSPEIAEQVRKAMAELQYTPKRPRRRGRAAGTRTGTGTIAIVSLGQPCRGWFEMPVMAGVIAEIGRAAQEHHLGTLITEMPDKDQLSPVLRRKEVDGALVFMGSHLDVADLKLLQQQLPAVRVMGGQLAPAQIDQVTSDNTAIGHLAADHLLDHGCSRPAFLTATAGWDVMKLRGHGFLAGAQKRNITARTYMLDADATLTNLYGSDVQARPSLEQLVDAVVADRSDGLFVGRDEETVRVYHLLIKGGVQPGRDINIVSCDNENVRLSMLHPRPASIDIGTVELGHWAVQRLVHRIRHPDNPPIRILVRPRLVLPQEIEMLSTVQGG